MNKQRNQSTTGRITQGAAIAAVYVALTMIVAPIAFGPVQYLRIRRAKDRHRQRKILQGIISRRLRIIGDRFDIPLERAALARAHDDRIDNEQQNDDALTDRQPEPVGEEKREHCKHDQKQQKHPRIGHQRTLQLGFIGYIADFGIPHRHTSLHPVGQNLLPP